MKLWKMDSQDELLSKYTCPIKQAVEFIDINDQYTSKENLVCRYKLKDYTPQEGDRVSLYQFGWKFVKDYILFEWASLASDTSNNEHFVTFNRRNLPKNLAELYQLCYISVNNELQGASAPFAIISDDSDSSGDSLSLNSHKRLSKTSNNEKDRIIRKLREENSMLKECLKALVEEKKRGREQRYDEFKQLKDITQKLYTTLKLQQTEIELLKAKVRGDEFDLGASFALGELKDLPPFPL